MSSDAIEPRLDPSRSVGSWSAEGFREAGRPEEPGPPDEALYSSSDDLSLLLAQSKPDPMLGSLDPGPPGSNDARREQKPSALPADRPAPPAPAAQSAGSSSAGVPVIDTSVRPPSKTRRAEPIDDADDDEPPARGVALSTLLLASYASAVTLGLIWVLWTGRRVKEVPEPPASVESEGQPDPGVRADRSRRVTAGEGGSAVAPVALGATVRLGVLEVTPLKVTRGTVVLERSFTRHEFKDGGKNALKLALRIKNVSKDVALAPLDEAFVRDRLGADPDTYIVPTEPAPTIGMYPLAVHSEWSIDGQEFRELRPGDSMVTQVVSKAGAALNPPRGMSWRVRLRTDIDHTEGVVVRFEAADVRADN